MNELALFAGAGGGILGGKLLGWRTVCAVELDAYCRRVLLARQRDGCLEPFPVWDDVTTFDGRPWAGLVDIVTGGFPCQDISSAGKRAGIDGERSGLWSEFARIIGEVRPRYVFVENSPMLTSRGLGRVLGDLAALGFDAEWGVLGAHHAGAPHKRDRIWVVARHPDRDDEPQVGSIRGEQGPDAGRVRGDVCDANREGESTSAVDGEVAGVRDVATADTECCELRHEPWRLGGASGAGAAEFADDGSQGNVDDTSEQQQSRREWGGWWQSEPDVGRVAHGVASRVDRLRAIGNGQVPAVVALAWRTLSERLR